MAKPHDFNPEEELEIYELFQTMRTEVQSAIESFLNQLMQGIQQQQSEEERLQSPETVSLFESAMTTLTEALARLTQPEDQDKNDADDDNEE